MSSRWNAADCQAAPLRIVTQRRSITPSSRSRSAAAIPARASPSSAAGSSRRSTSSLAGTSPIPGQYSCASIPSRAAAWKFSSAAENDMRDQSGCSSATSVRTRP